MKKLVLVLALLVPAIASADTWRWRDAHGRLHYSNDAVAVPEGARQLTGGIGYLGGDLPGPDAQAVSSDLARIERLHAERAIRRQLNDIDAFRQRLRAQQYLRLLRSAGWAQIFTDGHVSDRWLAMADTEGRLHEALAELEGRGAGGNDDELNPY